MYLYKHLVLVRKKEKGKRKNGKKGKGKTLYYFLGLLKYIPSPSAYIPTTISIYPYIYNNNTKDKKKHIIITELKFNFIYIILFVKLCNNIYRTSFIVHYILLLLYWVVCCVYDNILSRSHGVPHIV